MIFYCMTLAYVETNLVRESDCQFLLLKHVREFTESHT
jgi:hypothetical protein